MVIQDVRKGASWVVSDNQVRRLRKLIQDEDRLAVNAAKAGMDEKTARKYMSCERLPSLIDQVYIRETKSFNPRPRAGGDNN